MKKLFQITTLLLILNACSHAVDSKVAFAGQHPNNDPEKFYSISVGDTFSIYVSLPAGYDTSKTAEYPTIFLLDANLYFEVVAAIVKKYAEIGLLPPAIVVGVGYKDLLTMDSLRSRDLTYPLAIPEYEMDPSGKADKFLTFLHSELTPYLLKKYPINGKNQVLAGHSLGGYFTLYALHQALLNKNNTFSGYIAASPSTHYNRNYILSELQKSNNFKQPQIRSYVTFGGLEDEEEEDPTILGTEQVLSLLDKTLSNRITHKGDSYSSLGHMDTPVPTFVKGLRWVFAEAN